MNGSDTITGGIIIMPSAISAPLTTMSMTRNGMKMMKPMMNACLQLAQHERRHQGGHRDVVAVLRQVAVGDVGEQLELVVAGVVEHEVAQRLDAVLEGRPRRLVAVEVGLHARRRSSAEAPAP